jgi:hypothetical protein
MANARRVGTDLTVAVPRVLKVLKVPFPFGPGMWQNPVMKSHHHSHALITKAELITDYLASTPPRPRSPFLASANFSQKLCHSCAIPVPKIKIFGVGPPPWPSQPRRSRLRRRPVPARKRKPNRFPTEKWGDSAGQSHLHSVGRHDPGEKRALKRGRGLLCQ